MGVEIRAPWGQNHRLHSAAFQQFIERLYAALLGTEAGVEARLHAAMLSSALITRMFVPVNL